MNRNDWIGNGKKMSKCIIYEHQLSGEYFESAFDKSLLLQILQKGNKLLLILLKDEEQ